MINDEIKIKNLRSCKVQNDYDIKVDRSNSILGNKFYMSSEVMRDVVCDKYEEWIREKINNKDVAVINELHRLIKIYLEYGQLNLFCWCAPKRCHAESIKRILIEMMQEHNII